MSNAYACQGERLETSPDAGDYIAIAARNGRAYPVWADDRNDLNHNEIVYTSRFLLWGPDENTVSSSLEYLEGSMIRVTATWSTNNLERPLHVSLGIYAVTGKLVLNLSHGEMPAG